MTPKAPTRAELSELARSCHFQLNDEELSSYLRLIEGVLPTYARIDELVEPTLPVTYARTPGYRPMPEENSYNAWYRKTEIHGAAEGKLAGKRVALKDNICLAGVAMMNGTSMLEGYVPDLDATVVTRILDAGGIIAGKAVCENLCISGNSHTSSTGPVRNPLDPSRSTGGSSSGCGALVAAGEVDMAIGCDQGGSIRIPASWCGIVGLKATYGLIPYTGICPIEMTLDHAGPMTRTVADCALLLEVLAGRDGLDPRQADIEVALSYTADLARDSRGLRVGIVTEGFGWEGISEPDVDACVLAAAQRWTEAGATVEKVSIPMHRDGIHIMIAIGFEGPTAQLFEGNTMGTNWKGHYNTGLLNAFARARLTRADDMLEGGKFLFMLGRYLREKYHGHFYAKAQNLSRTLRAAYDAALEKFDILVMPTVPFKARKLPDPDASIETKVQVANEPLYNTAPFDVTGHPALSLPVGLSEGLPVGLMIVGRPWQETTVLAAAYALEGILGRG
jgi:amidase